MKSVELKNSDYLVKINHYGAELCSFRSLKDGTEYIWQADEKIWKRHSPNLFPFIGGLNNGEFHFNGKTYKPTKHGFARDNEFDLLNLTEDEVHFELRYNDDLLKVYPFKFSFQAAYKLSSNLLDVQYKVINLDDKEIYFSVGAHPAFNCPIEKLPGCDFTDYYIEFEREETASRFLIEDDVQSARVEEFLRNDKVIRLNKNLFQDDALVFKSLRSDFITLKSPMSDKYVKVSFPGFPYLGIWTKPGAGDFICIEPWYGIDDKAGFTGDISEKEGICKLNVSEEFVANYSIECG